MAPTDRSLTHGSGDQGDSWGAIGRDLRSSAVRRTLPVLAPVAVMWAVFIVTVISGNWITIAFGLEARSLSGLWGILFMPLLHGSLGHLVGNTISWIILGGMIALLTRRFILITGLIWLLTGVLLWLFGTPWICQAPEGFDCVRRHIGASGVIYGFAAFLIVYGIVARRLLAILFALMVMLGYGITMLFGMLPFTSGSGVSWTGHLFGAMSGVAVALWYTRGQRAQRKLHSAERTVERARRRR